ncbi:hypothetical protein [Microbacterium sp. 2RAF4]|uniref:hypothetical protein n=1 Tax=Microbacterium sp. 2RAF4 TaxID=3232999 RepID=UPI003F954E5E
MSQLLEINAAGREILGRPRDLAKPWGLFVKRAGFQGWEGLPAGRREALARAVEHGEHDVPTYLPARVVTIDGWVLAPNVEDLQHESDSLTGIGASGDRLRVQIQHRGSTRFADARRALAEVSDDRGQWTGRVLRAPFQLQFVFADPRRYGETKSFPQTGAATTISAAHYGNFPAFPVIEIPAAPAAYTITSAGRVFAVSGATAGGTHTVDLRRGRVYRNGVEMPGVGHGALWAIPPGVATAFTLTTAGRVKVTNTYV